MPPIDLDATELHRAVDSRDARCDGLFFVAITSTRIYCRPTCPSRRANPANRRFYSTAEEAVRDGYRACLRCHPEVAAGHRELDGIARLARRAADRIAAGALDGRSVATLAAELEVSERHLRRALEREFGLSPLALAKRQRARRAKELLVGTALPVTQVAFASGFQSLRRFNAVVRESYHLTPSALRRQPA